MIRNGRKVKMMDEIVINGITYVKKENKTQKEYKIEDLVEFHFIEPDLQQRIDKAIRYFEINKQECVIGRNKDGKLIKDYYLPSQLTPKIIKILKGE